MTTVINPPQLASETRFVLHHVSWETYEQLLKDYESRSVPRFTYDHGDLEIMSPSLPHETASRILSLLVNLICDESEIDVIDLGSMTQRRADLLQGVEPDGCFYIQNVEQMRGVRALDLTVHPPPDLVIEVDVTSPSIAKIPIYARLGVPEIWYFKNGQLVFLQLINAQYVSVRESLALSGILAEEVVKFVAESETMKRPEWLKSVRKWLRSPRRT